jgi:hypothetical protein
VSFWGFSGFGCSGRACQAGVFLLIRVFMENMYRADYYDESNIDPVDRCAGSDNRRLFKH